MPSENPYTDVHTKFRLLGFSCEHDKITKELGILPSEIWRKGDRRREGKAPFSQNAWVFQLECPKNLAAEIQIEEVINLFHPFSSLIRELVPQDGIKLTTIIEIYNLDRPPFTLKPSIIKKISELGALFDLDMYLFD